MSVCAEDSGIGSLFDSMNLFKIAMGLRVPVFEADRKELKKARKMVEQYLDRIEKVEDEEIEQFLDALTDLMKKRFRSEDLEKFKFKLSGLGRLAEIINATQLRYDSLDASMKAKFTHESIAVTLDRLREVELLMGERLIERSSSDEFDCIYAIQSIIVAINSCLKNALIILEVDNEVNEKAMEQFEIGFFGLLRIEAFKRNKIGVEDLHDTITLILASSSSAVEMSISDIPDLVGEEG
ncbi:MAG: hypothetical protein WCK39_07925 [Methanomassiliicoccales archaeon]